MTTYLQRATGVSDPQLERDVSAKLIESGRPSFRRIKVKAHHGMVRLRGTVDSFHERQLALRRCHDVEGVVKVIDDLETGF